MPSQNNKTAIILAGGLSKRMGFNKEELKIDNEYLVLKQIDILNSLFDEVIVVSNNQSFYEDKDVKVVQDIITKKSPLVGLHAGLSASSNDMNYLIACDMPTLDKEFIQYLIENYRGKEAFLVKQNGFYEPFNALYSKNIIKKLEIFTEDNLKFQDFIATLDVDIINDISRFNDKMFHNLNTQEDLNREMIDDSTYQEFRVTKHINSEPSNITDYVIKEFPITLYINQTKYVTMLITPTHIKELLVGYLKSEKIIDTKQNIESIVIDEENNTASIDLVSKNPLPDSNKDKLLSSGCGVGTRFHDDLDSIVIDAIESNASITEEEIINASHKLNNKSGLFKLTGGVHSCLFVSRNEEVYLEDIGRHNAVDKIVGYIELNDIDTSQSYIISSGRISSDMLLKCSISKIPIVMSRSAPTSLAITLAEKFGITLIGFVRGNRFNVYSNPYRVVR